ncbi:precorrin-3B C(17)-methyltransferase [Polycladidibacter hongkongensis]|uniref:precorrin-3B C(17)-methyltransferase n=1 Tax=Polycladidibacter hongkongensis TaxID=1647556 RepID=UPI0008332394|nr:precorrin-3B C(17)-methyltransferase [Pseudovibrio hongkongensis]
MATAPAILVVSPVALQTARKIAQELDAALIHGFLREGESGAEYDLTFSNTAEHMRGLFEAGRPIIGVCAAGIIIRALAPLLSDKQSEPPVLAVSEDGSAVVPLLGGHHGANRLAKQLAEALDGTAAITTAGDTAFSAALDEVPEGYSIGNPQAAKPVMAALLAGEQLKINGEAGWLVGSDLPISDSGSQQLTVTPQAKTAADGELIIHPKTHIVGLGCARGCPLEEVEALLLSALERANIAIGAVAAFTSIDLKADETAFNGLSQKYGIPLRVFSAVELEKQASRLQNPSDVVFAEVGCHGVSEGAALAAVGTNGHLVLPKQKTANATIAIASCQTPISSNSIGRARGRLHVVGIGPGRDDWRTPEASQWLSAADEVVGYGLYLDLVAPLIKGKQRHAFPLGAEEERVRFALERAATGRNVALVCSGDSGIYAMGALVYELLDRDENNGGVSDAARRIEVASSPGVSAMVALSNRIGAPLGHDFCAISLSDLLTPWETIQQRVTGAAQGDFTIGFYNPVSMRRRTQLAWARDKLLEYRPAETPVVLGSNIGRPQEKLTITCLGALEVDQVDMLTTVLVGSSQSKTGGNGCFVYTPRGYAKKIDAQLEQEQTKEEAKL